MPYLTFFCGHGAPNCGLGYTGISTYYAIKDARQDAWIVCSTG